MWYETYNLIYYIGTIKLKYSHPEYSTKSTKALRYGHKNYEVDIKKINPYQ